MSNRPSRSASHSARVSQASNAGKGSSPVLWIALAVVIVIAGVVAVAVSRSSGGAEGGGASPSGGTVVPSGDVDFGAVAVEGQALPPVGGGADAAVGQALPTVEGVAFDGSPLTIAPAGKPMIVLGLAHWCGHCQVEVPRLQEWFDDNGMPDDVDVVAMATGSSASQLNFPPGDWLREEQWSVPTLVDDEESTGGAAMGIAGYPAFVVVDADGAVVQRASGELSIEQWEQLLEAARTGTAVA